MSMSKLLYALLCILLYLGCDDSTPYLIRVDLVSTAVPHNDTNLSLYNKNYELITSAITQDTQYTFQDLQATTYHLVVQVTDEENRIIFDRNYTKSLSEVNPSFAIDVNWSHLNSGKIGFMRSSGQHTKRIRHLIVTHNNQSIISLGEDHTQSWNIKTGKLAFTFQDAIYGAYDYGNNLLVLSSVDGIFDVWNIHNGAKIYTVEPGRTSVSAVALSADESTIVSGYFHGGIRVWDIAGRDIAENIIYTGDSVRSIDISPNNNLIAIGRDDGSVDVWDRVNESHIKLAGHHSRVNMVKFSQKNANILYSADEEGVMSTWDLQEQKAINKIQTNHDWYDLEISRDESYFAASGEEGLLIVDLQTGVQRLLDNSQYASRFTFSADNKSVFLANPYGHNFLVLDAQTGKKLHQRVSRTFHGNIYRASFARDDDTLAFATQSNLNLIDTNTFGSLARISLQATLFYRQISLVSHDNMIYETRDQLKYSNFSAPPINIAEIEHTNKAISPNNKLIAVVDKEKPIINIIDTKTLQKVDTLESDYRISSAKFSKDNALLAFSDSRFLNVWDFQKREEQWIQKYSKAYDIFPDNSRIAAFDDRSFFIWDLKTNEATTHLLDTLPISKMRHIEISRDGNILVLAGDQQVCIWDTREEKVIQIIHTNSADINDISISKNNTVFVTVSNDGQLKIWGNRLAESGYREDTQPTTLFEWGISKQEIEKYTQILTDQ